jgi:hypothetical protein
LRDGSSFRRIPLRRRISGALRQQKKMRYGPHDRRGFFSSRIQGVFMTKTVLLATSAVLALSGGDACATAQNTAIVRGVAPHHVIFGVAPGSKTLYDQNIGDSSVGIASQNLESSVSQYDSQGADDFTVPTGHTWIVKEVDATGVYFNGSGPATSENVQFYKDKGGLPKGKPLAECDSVIGSDTLGVFAITLPKKCKVSLPAGHYQVSVAANLNGGGEWAWLTNNTVVGDPAAWQNEGGGFGFCPTWDVMTTCFGDVGEGGDFAFALKGMDEKL